MCGLIEINMLEMSVFTPKCRLVLHKPDVVSLITHRAYGAAKNIASTKINSLEEFL